MYQILDLFSGCGGMTLGFTDARFCGGFESTLAVDHNAAATASYARNFGAHAACGDIEDWAHGREPVPKAHVVIGGPPCQGFSLLNRGRAGDIRRALWQPYMDIVAASEAEIFVIENVSGLLRSPEYHEITHCAASLDFCTEAALLNAADYGVPQTRIRAFILGWKKHFGLTGLFPPPPSHCAENTANPHGLPCRKTVREAIGDLPPPEGVHFRNLPPPLDLHYGRTPTEKSLLRYKAVPPGGNRFDLQKNAFELTPACWLRKSTGSTDLFGRLWWDKPSVTIRTEFYKPEKGRYLHPEEHRPITLREAARLMGFPDDFSFCGSKADMARQIGNAVPPPLAGAVARTVRRMLDARAGKSANTPRALT